MKGIKHKFAVFGFFVLAFFSVSMAQRSNGLAIDGKISVEEGVVEGAVIQMFQDGRRLDNYGVGADGHYKVELNYNHKFELIFTLKDNFSQKIIVETEVPPDVLRTDPKFPPFPVDINLFTEIRGIDKSFSENAILKIYYNKNVDNFVSELYYNNAQIKKLIDQAILQSQMIDKEADYLSKLTRAELAELKKEYDKLLEEAGKEYSNEQFLAALDGYKAAEQIFPKEQYPKDRIAEINDLLGLIMVAGEMDKAMAERFNTLIKNADLLFSDKKYFDARNSYNRALSINKTNVHAQQKVNQINKILKNLQVEQQYDDVITRGINAFNEMLYDEALKIFNDALQIKPGDAFAKSKITEINNKINELAKNSENQKSYDQAVFQAELNFEKQFYDKSLTSYENALIYRPGDPRATQKISEIKKLMTTLSNKTLFEKFVKSADKAFNKKLYNVALEDYINALKLMPKELYPAHRIDEINQLLNVEAYFLESIKQADQKFVDQDLQESKSLYNKALEIHDNDKHALDRVKEIDLIFQQQGTDKQYQTIIVQADQLFLEKDYGSAKNKYNEALLIKSREQYPKNRISEINSILQNITKTNQEYLQVIKRADGLYQRKDYKEARKVYAEAGQIKPLEGYPPEMINKIDSVIQEQERILAEQQANEQARMEALKNERDKNYQRIVDEADRLVSENEPVAAIGKFRSALDIKPQEQYPIMRIEEIRGMITRQQVAQKAYEEAVSRGDREFRRESFDLARAAFKEAKQAKADEIYPDEMITKIDSIVATRARLANEAVAAEQARVAALEAENERQYNETILKADNFFNRKEYEKALVEYSAALKIKPEETYPQQRIDNIGTLLAQLSAAQKAYEEAVSRGDREFRRESFDLARTAFKEAKQAKADETYPDEMLPIIDSIVENRARLATEIAAAEQAKLAAIQAEKDNNYSEVVARADDFYNQGQYENARKEYRGALNVKPNETYPQQRIDAINKIISERDFAKKELELLNKNYENVIHQADKFFNDKNYKLAKTNYGKASGLKPEEAYPKQKIAEVDSILQQLERDENYRSIILAADGFFKTESYSKAKEAYENALTIKQDEQYPKNQVSKIDNIFEKEQKRVLAEQNAVADLERRRTQLEKKNKEIREQEINSEASLVGLYNEYIKTADELFEVKQYNVSRAWYFKAWDVKPEEKYPKQRIGEINRLISGLLLSQRDRDYQGFIDLADSTFRENQLAVARGWYNRALSVKEGEIYPKNQLTEIKKKITERLTGKSGEQFNNYIEKAGFAFEATNYNVARFWYKKALELKPDDETVKTRLKEIGEALK